MNETSNIVSNMDEKSSLEIKGEEMIRIEAMKIYEYIFSKSYIIFHLFISG